MRRLYLTIFKILGFSYFLLLFPLKKRSIIYIYTVYNVLCIATIVIGYYRDLNLRTGAYIICLSIILLILDGLKMGKWLQSFFEKWLFRRGLKKKDEAYKNMELTNHTFPFRKVIELFKDDIIFTNSLISKNPNHGNVKELKNDIKLYKETVKELKLSKENGIKVTATYFAGRRPFSFFVEQELPIASALSFTLLSIYMLVFFWTISTVDKTHIAFQFILAISIFYSIVFFSVVNIIHKRFSLSYEEVFKQGAKPRIKQLIDKYKKKSIEFDELIVYKDFFKHYFSFYRSKAILSILLSSFYFLLSSAIFLAYEYFIYDNNIISYLEGYWFKFFLIVATVILSAHIWFASFTMTSLIKTTLTNFVLLILLFGAFTYVIEGNWEMFLEKIRSSGTSVSILSLFISYFISATRKMFLDKENGVVWKLK